MRILLWWDAMLASYWFVPSVIALAAIALALGMPFADHAFNILPTAPPVWWLYAGDAQGARSVLSTIAGSIITVTSVTFSITVAAFSLASQQYGPRLLRGFLRDVANQVVLGIFVGTFLYCLLVLRTVRGNFVPSLSITVGDALAVATVGVFIFFIHHVTISIQADSIIGNLGNEFDDAVARLYPEKIGKDGAEANDEISPLPRDFEPRSVAVLSGAAGYVTAIDNDRVLEIARRRDLIVKIASSPSTYVEPGALLVQAYPRERVSDETAALLRAAFTLGRQRTVPQDVGFAAQGLAEIASRALSPGINDPYTAIMVLDRLRTSLTLFAQRRMPSAARRDESGVVRIIAQPVRFSDIVRATLDPIKHYGRSSPMVLNAILDTLAAVRPHIFRAEDARELDLVERETLDALSRTSTSRADA